MLHSDPAWGTTGNVYITLEAVGLLRIFRDLSLFWCQVLLVAHETDVVRTKHIVGSPLEESKAFRGGQAKSFLVEHECKYLALQVGERRSTYEHRTVGGQVVGVYQGEARIAAFC
jgi:hypothetical protein